MAPYSIISDDNKAREQLQSDAGRLILVPGEIVKKKGLEKALDFLGPELKASLLPFTTHHLPKPKGAALAVFDLDAKQRVAIQICPEGASAFRRLEIARKAIAPLLKGKAKQVVADLRGVEVSPWAEALVSAMTAATYSGPKYGRSAQKETTASTLFLRVSSGARRQAETAAEEAFLITEGTNLVRRLSTMAGNDLTTARYVVLATEMAKAAGLSTEFLSFEKLRSMGAGAFCAVAQGSHDKHAGILKVHYSPKGAKKRVAFVGKGITFDTGGANLKTGGHMFGMHEDMAGSAVALALVLWAARRETKFAASAYLAIADNQLSAESYRPNDVVTSLSGKTIEVVDTDAEGRMVLADALTVASKDKPDLIVDFATLTGSCIRAIGKNYSGAYTNRKGLMSVIRACGKRTGERVWPFPNDADYGRCLKSKVADLLQCRHQGGVDHIEASYFLRQFVDKQIPYVHIDLSAIHHDGGLAHVPSTCTGFGVRFGAELARQAL